MCHNIWINIFRINAESIFEKLPRFSRVHVGLDLPSIRYLANEEIRTSNMLHTGPVWYLNHKIRWFQVRESLCRRQPCPRSQATVYLLPQWNPSGRALHHIRNRQPVRFSDYCVHANRSRPLEWSAERELAVKVWGFLIYIETRKMPSKLLAPWPYNRHHSFHQTQVFIDKNDTFRAQA